MSNVSRGDLERDFRALLVSRTASKLGTEISAVAFPLIVLHLTGSALDVGLVSAAEGLCLVLTLLPAGLAADLLPRRRILLCCDAVSLLLLAVMSAVLLRGRADLLLLTVVACGVSLLAGAFHPAMAATFRALVPPGGLTTAMRVNEARNAAVHLAGPPLGGWLFSVHLALPFAVDAASFAASLLGVCWIRSPLRGAGRRAGRTTAAGRGAVLTGLVTEMGDGVRHLWRQPLLRYTTWSGTCLNALFAGVLLAVVVVPARAGFPGWSIGAVMSCVGAGALLGNVLAGPLLRHVPALVLLRTVPWVCAVDVLAMASTSNGYVLGVLAGSCTVLVPAVNVTQVTIQTALTPDGLQGRVNAATSFLATAAAPLGPAATGALLDVFPPALAFVAMAALFAAFATWSSLGSRRFPAGAADQQAPALTPVWR